MTPDKAMDEQALRIDTQLCAEGKVATSAAYAIEFAHRLRAEWMAQQEPPELQERVAQLIAHRACHNQEQDAGNGKLAGYCIVCGVPWPCLYAGAASIAKPAAQDCVVVPIHVAEELLYPEDSLEWAEARQDLRLLLAASTEKT